MHDADLQLRPILFSLACALALAPAGAAPAGAAPAPHRTLFRCAPPPSPAEPGGAPGAGPILLAAAFDPAQAPAAAWPDRLQKLQRGGFAAVRLLLPWNVGQAGALQADDLRALLRRCERLGLKVILGPPLDGSTGDARAWVDAIRPALADKPASVLWIQASAKSAPALAGPAAALQPPLPVVVGNAVPVEDLPAPEQKLRPYRDPHLAAALRAAAADRVPALVWDSPFAGYAPPLAAETADGLPPSMTAATVGGLPVGYYETRTFAQVARTLGAALAGGEPADGASADADRPEDRAKVYVSQRNAADRGYLLVRVAGELRGYRLSFTDPATKQKVSVPQQDGLRLRTYGPETRLLPLNLPLPGTKARVRYCTAEVYGAYRVAGTTFILVADDPGAPNEISLALESEEEPPVLGTPAQPLWDAKAKTLTLGFIASMDDDVIQIGADLALVVVPSERAQRTWLLRAAAAGQQNVLLPVISGAYLCGEGSDEKGRLAFHLATQQGSTPVSVFVPRKVGGLTIDGLPARQAYSPATGVLTFPLRSAQLASLHLKDPAVQVLREARFLAGGTASQAECARPDYAEAAKWPQVRLDRARGGGWLRMPFAVPGPARWSIPWQLTLQLKGSAAVYLNGTALGAVTGSGGSADAARLDVPEGVMRPEGEMNVLALCATRETTVQKVMVMPFMQHAVEQHEIALLPPPP